MSDRLTASTVIRVYWPFPERFEKILENKLTRFESSDPVKIEVDCRQMNRITALHISSLLEAKLCCDERQLSMILVSVNENLQRVIEKLDLNELFMASHNISPVRAQKDSGATINDIPTILEFDVFPNHEAIQEAISTVSSFLHRNHSKSQADFVITTILYEVITNIRLHSTLEHDEKISLSVHCDNTRIKISVKDPGIAFDPSQAAPPLDIAKVIASKKTSGFGLYMIKRLSDEVTYSRLNNEINVFTFIKEW